MPRRPREEFPGAVHHVFARGIVRRSIFVDDDDRRAYLGLLGTVVIRQRWRCLAYCLMDNHVHLLLETPEPNLGAGMQRLHGTYGREFNDRHERSGHVFQGPYGSARVKRDAHLVMAAAYIAANPVEAGACRRPEDWSWSSHAALLRGTAPAWLDVPRMLGPFAAAGGDPWRRYLAAVDDRTRPLKQAA
jgi:putative transposase